MTPKSQCQERNVVAGGNVHDQEFAVVPNLLPREFFSDLLPERRLHKYSTDLCPLQVGRNPPQPVSGSIFEHDLFHYRGNLNGAISILP